MKKLFGLIALVAALIGAAPSFAYERDYNAQFNLNNTANANFKTQLGDQIYINAIRSQRCTWSFKRQGGSSAAAIQLQGADGDVCRIPPKALVVNTLWSVTTAITAGSTATLALSTGVGASDIQAAYWQGAGLTVPTGYHPGIPVWSTPSSIVKVGAADVVPTITIATAPLTAGALDVFIQYVLSN